MIKSKKYDQKQKVHNDIQKCNVETEKYINYVTVHITYIVQ